MIHINPMTAHDIGAVAKVHSEAFVRQFSSNKWIECNFKAYPRMMLYVAVTDNHQVVGYIQWMQKSGFRKEAVLELDQMAVLPAFQGKKIGTELIVQSLKMVKEYIESQNSTLKYMMVTTGINNHAAQKLYQKTLGAEIKATVKDLFSHDEVIMIATP